MAERRSADSNIYTVLVCIALLALLAGVAYVLYRNNAIFGGNPFSPPQTPASLVTTSAAIAGPLAN